MNFLKKDKVTVLTGRDRGKQGEIVRLDMARQRAVVSKINIVTKHVRPTREKPGGIQRMEGWIHISNLQLLCSKCNQPTRPKAQFFGDGTKARVCRRCGEAIL